MARSRPCGEFVGTPGGVLFRVTPAASFPSGSNVQFRNDAFHLKHVSMCFSARCHDAVLRKCKASALEIFLEHGFGILADGLRGHTSQGIGEQAPDHRNSRFETAIEKYRAHHSFDGISEYRGPLESTAPDLALAQENMSLKAKR
jgi:hypothetical protein